MAREYKAPTESYEEAYRRLDLEKLVKWVWKHRVRNTLNQARQRGQDEADIALVSRRGKKLRHRDNEVVNQIQLLLMNEGYRFDPPRATEGQGAVFSKVRISPVRPVGSSQEAPQENHTSDV